MNKYYIYNSTSHDVKIYGMNSLRSNRKNQFFLASVYEKPLYTIRQNEVLNMTENMQRIDDFFFQSFGNFSLPNDFNRYDIIIVSSKYACAAIQNLYATNLQNSAIYSDFLDRLYTLVPVYNVNPDSGRGFKIGSAGLKKLLPPQSGIFYYNLLCKGINPNLQAVSQCSNMLQGHVPAVIENYIKIRTSESLNNVNGEVLQGFNWEDCRHGA